MKRWILFLLSIFLLCGCSANQHTAPIPASEPTAAPILPVIDAPEISTDIPFEFISVTVPATMETYAAEDGTPLFAYMGQHIEIIHPDASLADTIILDFLNRVDKVMPDVQATYTAALETYDPEAAWYPYFYHILYHPTRIDNDVLSLSGVQSSYSGGVHGNSFAVAANYDMMTGDVLTWGSIMHEDATKDDFIQIILEKLKEREDEDFLFDDYEESVNRRFMVDENLYEDFYFTTTGLCFYFSSYEIAPYASGMITVEIPYEELPGLIYDGYFPAEREQIQGNICTAPMHSIDLEQFENMVEVKLSESEDAIVIYPEGTVEDIRITVNGDGQSVPSYTVFASPKMTDSDAIILYVLESEIPDITIHYYSGSSIVEQQLTV